MNLIKHLKSNNFAIIIAILSVLVQSFHSFSVFYRLSSIQDTIWGIVQAILFSLVIDLAILFYTVRKNVKVTWMAGFIMVLINLFYYYTHLGLGMELIMGGLLSLVIPVSVYYYSEEIEDEVMEVEYEPAHRQEILNLEKEIENLRETNNKLYRWQREQAFPDNHIQDGEDRPSDKSLAGIKGPMPHTDRPTR